MNIKRSLLVKIYLLAAYLSLTFNFVTAQNETSKWFLSACGMDFMTTPATPFFYTPNVYYANSSISDSNGNILFYASGDTIWNSANQVMSNGGGLNGNIYAAQSTLIMKKPGSSHLYYVFTQNGNYGNLGVYVQPGLRYAIVDMSLSAGQGSVVVKNTMVDTTASLPKLAGTNHCNGIDAWILIHDKSTTNFKAFLLTSNGLVTTPVVSSVGLNGINSSLGTMKFSPNGKKIGYSSDYRFCLFDFDNASGKVSNFLDLGQNSFMTQGCEFSPDGTKFYGAYHYTPPNNSAIRQWDLCAGSNTAIMASMYTYTNQYANFQEMQLAKDGRIYIGGIYSFFGNGFLGNGFAIIDKPNDPGAACNIYLDTLLFTWVLGSHGLPNFNSSFFNPPDALPVLAIKAKLNCGNAKFELGQTAPAYGCSASGNRANAIQWDFGDPSSGAANTSTLLTPEHVYVNTGNYTVQAIAWHDCRTDTFQKVISVNYINKPVLSFAANDTICPGMAAIIYVSGADTYTWSNGIISSSINVSPINSGIYTVTGTSTLTQCYSTEAKLIVVLKCTDIYEISNENSVNVFPNPATDKLIFNVFEEKNVELKIYDNLGREIIKIESYKNFDEINIERFEKGSYYYTIRNKNIIVNGKFIKM